MKIASQLHQAIHRGDLRPLDLEIGLFLMERGGREELLFLAGALVSAATDMGNTCMPISAIRTLFPWLDRDTLPEPDQIRSGLLATPAVAGPGGHAPLILDRANRLYLYRYWAAEQRIAADLQKRAARRLQPDHGQAAGLLGQLFAGQRHHLDLQQLAVAMAQLSGLLILSGGPGTGKTWTAARILRLAQALADAPLRIALAAPTGKAAARLDESIRASASIIDLAGLPELPEAATLHRLLGYRPDNDSFRHNRTTPLALDILLVDEASMIDLILMDNLLAALPDSCRLILLGDHHQLASVEAGSLFGDLCRAGGRDYSAPLAGRLQQLTGDPVPVADHPPSPIGDLVVQLEQSYRFTSHSPIGRLASAINRNNRQTLTATLTDGSDDLIIHDPADGDGESWLRRQILAGYDPLCKARSIDEAFAAFASFRILCALRKGRFGVAGMNALCREILVRTEPLARQDDLTQGQPIIIRRNHYQLGLFNGDTGILWPDARGRIMAWFKGSDNHIHAIAPGQLPAYEPAWAITVHKAQGSEFDRVLLVLPGTDSRVLSRELLYTAVTRAKKELALFADRELLATAMARPMQRFSGLAGMLGHSETKSFAKRRFSGTT